MAKIGGALNWVLSVALGLLPEAAKAAFFSAVSIGVSMIWAKFNTVPLPYLMAVAAFFIGSIVWTLNQMSAWRSRRSNSTAPREIEFYGSQADLNSKTGGIQEEVKRVQEAWAASPTGVYITGSGAFLSRRITRLVLIHPDGDYLPIFANAVSATDVSTREESIRSGIRHATATAQECGAEVRWFDGPITNLFIADPGSDDSRIRVGVNHPFGGEHIGFSVKRSGRHRRAFDEFRESYDALWTKSNPAPRISRGSS